MKPWKVHHKEPDGAYDFVRAGSDTKWAAVDRVDLSLCGDWHQCAVVVYAGDQQTADRRADAIAKALNWEGL